MRPGWNPTKRNRNIGTEEQGKGQENKLVVPRSRHCDYYKLDVAASETREVAGQKIKFLVERTQRGCVHSCTIEDIATVLSHVPSADIEGLGLIVLRQPSKKQELIDAYWGCIVYEAEIEKYIGPTIFIEATKPGQLFKWSKSLTPFWVKELDRLRSDGHKVIDNGKEYSFVLTNEAVRATQLFRTLPHELGHYVDYKTTRNYKAKTEIDKEAFAHRYAEEFRRKLFEEGLISGGHT